MLTVRLHSDNEKNDKRARPGFEPGTCVYTSQKQQYKPILDHVVAGCPCLKKCAPNVGLEPTTLRLRVSCSTD